jgi:two-component system sensor kinase FixL
VRAVRGAGRSHHAVAPLLGVGAAPAEAATGRDALGAAIVVGVAALVGVAMFAAGRLATRRRDARAPDDTNRIGTLLALARDAVVTIDAKGIVEHASPALETIFGYPPEELVGENVSRLMPSSIAERHPAYIRHHLATGETRFTGAPREVMGRRRDGSAVPLEVVASRFTLEGEVKFTAILRDITPRREAQDDLAERSAELARSNAVLERRTRELARSNGELEQFAAVASHDLQEPLRKLVSYMSLLEADCAPALGDEGRRYIAQAIRSAERMRRLIDSLLQMSRVAAVQMDVGTCDLNRLAAEALSDLELAIRDAEVTVEVGDLPRLEGDPTHLRLVFLNLVSNAIKYRGPVDPKVRITAAPAGHDWQLTVSDNGIGFPQEYADQIFGMFQRLVTRGRYDGTGIGLAIVAKVVANHGGRVWATSEPGAGSHFHVLLPARQPSPTHEPFAAVPPVAGLPDREPPAPGRAGAPAPASSGAPAP